MDALDRVAYVDRTGPAALWPVDR